MASYRLAIVTPRFWPLIDDRTTHLLRLAEALAADGHQVTVVTPRWTRRWPEHMTLGPLTLARLSGDDLGGLGSIRWLYALARWLRAASRFDAILVSGLKHEAYVAVRAGRASLVPVVLQASEDCLAWQKSALLGKHVATECHQAAKIVAPVAPLADSLLSAGYDAQRVTIVPRGAAPANERTIEKQTAARAALAAVNYDLATTSTAFVALAIGRLDQEHRFGDLVRAWRIVTARHSDARLWLVGDGPERERLYRQIGDLDQRFRAFLPGTVECLTDLLTAADVLLVPGHHQIPPLAMLDTAASALPCIAADSPAARHCLSTNTQQQIYPLGDAKTIATQVLSLIENPNRKQAANQQTIAHGVVGDSPGAEAAAYLAILKQLTAN